MTVRAKYTTLERNETIHVLFDAFDNKGRRFGASARIDLVEFSLADADALCPCNIPETMLGHWYHVDPHATRDGAFFGALQTGKSFRTKDEALAYIAKYFRDAERRALKNKARAA